VRPALHIFVIIPASVAAFLLAAEPAFANPVVVPIAVEFGCACWPVMTLLIVVIEMVIIARITGMASSTAFLAVFSMNFVSIVIGAIIYMLLDPFNARIILVAGAAAILLCSFHALTARSNYLALVAIPFIVLGGAGVIFTQGWHGTGVLRFAGMVFLALSFSFGIALATEVWPARLFVPAKTIDRAVVTANIYSYCFLTVAVELVAIFRYV
jgi:hypothetical protein